MKKSRADARRFAIEIVLLAGGLGACARAVRPSQEAIGIAGGEWIDVNASAGADTTVWRLRSDGRREVITYHEQRATSRRTDHWYAELLEGDSASARICFVKRRGRDGASCSDVQIRQSPAGGRELLLLATWLRSGGAPRVLLERRHGSSARS